MTQSHQSQLLWTSLIVLLPVNALAELILDIELQDIFALLRYLIGFGFAVCGMVLLTYTDLATHQFLSHYTEHTKGQVVACEALFSNSNSNSNNTPPSSRKCELQVLYTSIAEVFSDQYVQMHPHHSDSDIASSETPAATGADGLFPQEYIRRITTNWQTLPGTPVELLLVPGQPRSAITQEFWESQRQSFSFLKVGLFWGPGCLLAALFLGLSIRDIQSEFPPDAQWVGWLLLLVSATVIIGVSWSIGDSKFQQYAKRTFMAAYPVHRKDAEGNIVRPTPNITPRFPPSPTRFAMTSRAEIHQTTSMSSTPSKVGTANEDDDQAANAMEENRDPLKSQPREPEGLHFASRPMV